MKLIDIWLNLEVVNLYQQSEFCSIVDVSIISQDFKKSKCRPSYSVSSLPNSEQVTLHLIHVQSHA